MDKLKLHLYSPGDPAVGIFSATFDADVPFTENDEELREAFRKQMTDLYQEFGDCGIIATYSDEKDRD